MVHVPTICHHPHHSSFLPLEDELLLHPTDPDAIFYLELQINFKISTASDVST
jgi:hypothetical protein